MHSRLSFIKVIACMLVVRHASAKSPFWTINYSYPPDSEGGWTKENTRNVPKFSLKNPEAPHDETYTIIFFDNGCPTNPVLHYLQSNFTVDEDNVLASSNLPSQPYIGPGALGEAGDGREYTWVLYRETGISPKTIPKLGGDFHIDKFEAENHLHRLATEVMQTTLGGSVHCSNKPFITNITTTTTSVNGNYSKMAEPTSTDLTGALESIVESIYSSFGPSALSSMLAHLPSTTGHIPSTKTPHTHISTATGLTSLTGNMTVQTSRTLSASVSISANSSSRSSPSNTPNVGDSFRRSGLIPAFSIVVALFIVFFAS